MTPFENTHIKNLSLKNRFVRSATWEGLAEENGSSTKKLSDFMVQLARGGVGLIITGHVYVLPVGQASPRQLGVHKDSFVPDLREMSEAVHREGGKIAMQLAHAGCAAVTKLSGMEALGPSVLEIDGTSLCREMTAEEIAETVKAFGAGAGRAKEAGFDGVQIHAAHGYLLSQFLSPYYNKRRDSYGGGIENRARIVLESYRAIREAVGNDFPVFIKLNSEDFLEKGLTKEEMIAVASMLEKEGIDAVELSGGSLHSDKKLTPVRPGVLDSEGKEAFYLDAAKKFKDNISIPLMLVGGIRSYERAEKLVTKDRIDYISMSRPLIREPGIIHRWESGDLGKSACRSDNACFRPAYKGEGLSCVLRKKEGAAR